MKALILRIAAILAVLRARDPRGTPQDWRRRGGL